MSRAAERDVRLPEVERADALLEREQRLADLGPLELALLAGTVEGVVAALRPREVDERELAGDGVGLFLGGGAEDELRTACERLDWSWTPVTAVERVAAWRSASWNSAYDPVVLRQPTTFTFFLPSSRTGRTDRSLSRSKTFSP